MLPAQQCIDPKLVEAIRGVIYRERGKVPLSLLISTLRNSGWAKLGPVDTFTQQCITAGFSVEHTYKKTSPATITRTFIKLSET